MQKKHCGTWNKGASCAWCRQMLLLTKPAVLDLRKVEPYTPSADLSKSREYVNTRVLFIDNWVSKQYQGTSKPLVYGPVLIYVPHCRRR